MTCIVSTVEKISICADWAFLQKESMTFLWSSNRQTSHSKVRKVLEREKKKNNNNKENTEGRTIGFISVLTLYEGLLFQMYWISALREKKQY